MQNMQSLSNDVAVNEIMQLIEKTVGRKTAGLTLNDNILEKLGLDSMTALEIMAAIEQKYKIKIQERDLPKITSVASILNIIKNHTEKK